MASGFFRARGERVGPPVPTMTLYNCVINKEEIECDYSKTVDQKQILSVFSRLC